MVKKIEFNGNHLWWLIPLLVVMIVVSGYIGYFEGYGEGYGTKTLNIGNAFDFCESQGYIMCSVSQSNITCGLNSCFSYAEGNRLYTYDNPTFKLIDSRGTDCLDSDGIDYYKKGVLRYNLDSDEAYKFIYVESCSSAYILNEYYCNSSGSAHAESYRCPKGCGNGACTP